MQIYVVPKLLNESEVLSQSFNNFIKIAQSSVNNRKSLAIQFCEDLLHLVQADKY